jgi:hypothetical protein
MWGNANISMGLWMLTGSGARSFDARVTPPGLWMLTGSGATLQESETTCLLKIFNPFKVKPCDYDCFLKHQVKL